MTTEDHAARMKIMIRTLVKTANVAVENRNYQVRYFELRTPRGHRRYSAEIMLPGRSHHPRR